MRDRTFVNHTVRITVVKVACYTDLGEKYAQYRPGAERGTVVPCNFFKEGMTFTVQLDPFGNRKPEGFCDWACADIWKDVLLVCDRAGFCQDFNFISYYAFILYHIFVEKAVTKSLKKDKESHSNCYEKNGAENKHIRLRL